MSIDTLDLAIKNGLVDPKYVHREGEEWFEGFKFGYEAGLNRVKEEIEDLLKKEKEEPIKAIMVDPKRVKNRTKLDKRT